MCIRDRGYGTIWKSPNSSAQNENVPNGEVLSCHHHYTDANGDIWGGAWSGDSEKLRGWINISRDFAPVADYLSFQEAHGDEFVGYDKSYDDAFAGLETAVLWTYPGSGKISQEVDARWFQENMDVSDFQEYYLDEAGRCWGFVGYCYGIRDTWVCLSDPANSGLDRIEGIIPGAVSLKGLLIMAEEAYPPSEAVPAPKSGIGLTTILLVAAAAVSYTHLDVYKRQSLCRPLPALRKLGAALRRAEGDSGGAGMWSWLYHWLDVYKRQPGHGA